MTTQEIFTLMLTKILKREKYYFAKFIDAFYKLPDEHQEGLLKFVVDEIGSAKWEALFVEPMDRPALLRQILMHYSGRKAAHQPDKREFAKMIGLYMESDSYSENEEDIVREPPAFLEAIEEVIDGRK
jgi:hypothetical protein